jgi:ABC-type multidrug transport system fused ATPase/permease subunit
LASRPILDSLALLTKSDKRRLLMLALVQSALSILDLVGVLLLGLVAVSATATLNPETAAGLGGVQGKLVAAVSSSPQRVAVVAAAAGALLILKSALSFVITRYTFKFLAGRQAHIAAALSERLFSKPLLFVQRRSSQETAQALIGGVNSITMSIIGNAMIAVSEASLIIALTIALLFVDPVVTAFTILFFGSLAFILQRVLGNRARHLGAKLTRADIDSYEVVQDSTRAYREISVAGRRRYFIHRFARARGLSSEVLADTFLITQAGKYVFEIGLVVGAGLLVLGMSTSRSLAGAVGIITVFLAAAARIFPSLLRLQSALLNIRNASGVAEPTFQLLRDLDESDALDAHVDLRLDSRIDKIESTCAEPFSATAHLRGVSLTYPGAERAALVEITFTAAVGQTVAVVGPTGSGKSTLADVILGVLAPDAGSAQVSGVSPSQAIRNWPGSVAYVPQHIALLNSSVRENVALGWSPIEIDDDAVWHALERAHLAEFLRAQRDGLETLVGENGVQLSGGQRQRLGIARALYTRPKLIILDEATSALDAQTESDITDTLQSLSGQVTLVIIAHRLATVMNADRVDYLHGGRILASGTFQQVRALVPDFDHQAHLLGL